MTYYDNTKLSDFATCEELYRLRHELGLVPARDDGDQPLRTGKVAHSGLEAWFGKTDTPAAWNAMRNAIIASYPVETVTQRLQEQALADRGYLNRAMLLERMEQYAERWPREQDRFDVIANEEWLEGYPLRDKSLLLGGLRDRLRRDSDGGIRIMDTKTTRQYISGSWVEQWAHSPQQLQYCALELVHGREVRGWYIDAIHMMPRKRDSKAKTPLLDRLGPYDAAPHLLDQWAQWVEDYIQRIEAARNGRGPEIRWPQTGMWTGACQKYSRPCMFAPTTTRRGLCFEPQELHAEIITSEYEVKRWDPREEHSDDG